MASTFNETATGLVAATATQIADGAVAFANKLASAVPDVAGSVACGQETMRLLKMSDAQLAELGLERDDVVGHVYRDL